MSSLSQPSPSPSPPPTAEQPVLFTQTPAVDLVESPWRTYAELERVYKLIYGEEDDVRSLTEVRSTLIAWSHVARKKSSFRNEILTIAAFVEADLQDKQGADEAVLQSLYGTALIRFGETLKTYEKKQGTIRRTCYMVPRHCSRYDEATSLGLPAWLVDLRNSAAHGELNALDLLRRATILAMDWLDQNFWPIVLVHKRTDRRLAGIIEHVFSEVTSVDPAAKKEFNDLLSHAPVSTIKFTVRSLLRATVSSDLTLYHVDPKTATLIAVITTSGQVHVLMHCLIDHFKDEDSEIRSAANLWFSEVIRGMTTKSSPLSDPLHTYYGPKTTRFKLIEVQMMKVLVRLLMSESDFALSHIPRFQKLIPSRNRDIERLKQTMATYMGQDLTEDAVPVDYEPKTLDHLKEDVAIGKIPNGVCGDRVTRVKKLKK